MPPRPSTAAEVALVGGLLGAVLLYSIASLLDGNAFESYPTMRGRHYTRFEALMWAGSILGGIAVGLVMRWWYLTQDARVERFLRKHPHMREHLEFWISIDRDSRK